MKYIICHYNEIALKGKNRVFFEKKLIENIKLILPQEYYHEIKRTYGRIIISANDDFLDEIKDKLIKVFGLAYFCIAEKTDLDLEKIKEKAVQMMDGCKGTFRVTTKRGKKSFPYTSQEISANVGAIIVEKLGLKVSLKKFDYNCLIEITDTGSFLYFEKIKGYGGLPISSSGSGSLLLSGGIDSPVAGFKMMKRGLLLNMIHFHAYPIVSNDSIKKVKKIFAILKEYSPKSKLFLVPFGEAQKEIVLTVPESLRIIFYRRLMLKIAEDITYNESGDILVTGESLGQVSSQTIFNLKTTQNATNLLIFRPLIGENKEEIIEDAKNIKTYPISILPDQDCCTIFNPQKPDTKSNLEKVLEIEKKLDIKNLKEVCIKNIQTLT